MNKGKLVSKSNVNHYYKNINKALNDAVIVFNNVKKHKHSSKIFKMLSQTQIEIRQQLRKWRLSIELSFGYNPAQCSCGNFMIFFKLIIPTKYSIATTIPTIV